MPPSHLLASEITIPHFGERIPGFRENASNPSHRPTRLFDDRRRSPQSGAESSQDFLQSAYPLPEEDDYGEQRRHEKPNQRTKYYGKGIVAADRRRKAIRDRYRHLFAKVPAGDRDLPFAGCVADLQDCLPSLTDS